MSYIVCVNPKRGINSFACCIVKTLYKIIIIIIVHIIIFSIIVWAVW